MPSATVSGMMTGMDLRVERVRARVTVRDLAQEMGVSRTRITTIESLERPTPQATQRYRAALAAVVASKDEAAA